MIMHCGGLTAMKMFSRFVLVLVLASMSRAADRPNVVFILADDLGWADAELYGHTTFHQTPNLMRLAKRGMNFSRAYSASPLCSPTRSAILTGLSPARTGITVPGCHEPQVVLEATVADKAPADQKSVSPRSVTRLKTEYRTLAETLKEAGYATGHFGKWHLGAEPYSPLEHGFDVDVPHWSGPGPAGSFVAPWKFPDFKARAPGEHLEDRMADEAVVWLEKVKDRPFFLNYWMFSVHAPFDAKREFIERHRGRVDTNDLQRCPTYAAMVQSMDDAIGKLLDTLDRLGVASNTIVIFTSDNGGNMYNEVEDVPPTSNGPLRGGKATLFEGGTRVPCVVAWPGHVKPEARSDAVIQSEDYYPTLLEALGLEPAPDQRCDGISALPAWRGEEFERGAIFQYFPHSPAVPDWLPPAVSVHRGDWKLIRIFHGGEKGAHRYLLFNLREDLSEKNNLAAAKPELVAELDALIAKFLADTKAVVPVPNPAFDPAQFDPTQEGRAKPRREQAPGPAGVPKIDGDPALLGWKTRQCSGSVGDGIARITDLTDRSFLGFAAGTHAGPSTVCFRIKAAPATAHVDWLPDGPTGMPNTVPYTLEKAGWQEVAVHLPATNALGVVRVYLPKQDTPIELDWIEIRSERGGVVTRCGF